MGELIYRDDAIVALTQSADYIGDALDRLCKVPVVDAMPVVHGRWIDENPGEYLDPRMRCSVCMAIEMPLIKWRYCPDCGAKMEV